MSRRHFSHLAVHQLEEVVGHKVLAAGRVAGQLESLRVVHGVLLFVHLYCSRVSLGCAQPMRSRPVPYQELSGHQDDDAAVGQGGLGIESRDLVLDLAEAEALFPRLTSELASHCRVMHSCVERDAYRELLDNSLGAENRGRLKREHRLLALYKTGQHGAASCVRGSPRRRT